MAKPLCSFSEVVRVSLDEIMTEFLRRFPEPELLAAIQSAAIHSQERLRHRPTKRRLRDNPYKAQVFFRHMAERLPSVPDDLSCVLGLKSKDPSQLEIPGVTVDASPPEMPPPVEPPKDEFASLFDIPTFEEYRNVFNTWPYVLQDVRKDLGRVLVLGYASGRNKDTEELIRRNCAVSMFKKDSADPTEREEHSFNDLVSVIGFLKHNETNGLHRSIKAIRYQPGMGVRFWTNTGKGDRADLSRYVVLTESGFVTYPARMLYEEALRQFKPAAA
jgi:hypothetical protein